MSLTKKVAVVGVVSILVAIGCSSSDETTSSMAKACTLPASVPSTDDFCAALASHNGRCGHCSDCTGQNMQSCAKRGAAMSAAHRAALIKCKDESPCDPAFTSLLGCVQTELGKATPTPAQQQAKDAYCTACRATNQADCDSFFATNLPNNQNGAGYSILLGGDSTATKAVTTCASKCDPNAYGICVALILCGEDGGDYCADGGPFCKTQP